MARHTVLCSAGRRLDVQPCKTSPGLVQVQILGADRQVIASCTIDANAAAVLSQALDIEAHAAAEISNAAARVVDQVDEGKAVPGVRRVGPAMVQAYADTNGVPPAQVARVPKWGAGLETAFNRATAGA